eukprot:1153946-Pelagomonas_calceolata.AAC.4
MQLRFKPLGHLHLLTYGQKEIIIGSKLHVSLTTHTQQCLQGMASKEHDAVYANNKSTPSPIPSPLPPQQQQQQQQQQRQQQCWPAAPGISGLAHLSGGTENAQPYFKQILSGFPNTTIQAHQDVMDKLVLYNFMSA